MISIDYIYLIGLSAGIGLYHGCIRSKQLSTNEFLIADGRMKVNNIVLRGNRNILFIGFTNCDEFTSKYYVGSDFTWWSS